MQLWGTCTELLTWNTSLYQNLHYIYLTTFSTNNFEIIIEIEIINAKYKLTKLWHI